MSRKPIPFKTMTLEQAAKFLECDVDDLFQWWEERAIKLCIDCKDLRAEIIFTNDEKDFDPLKLDEVPFWQDEYSSFMPIRVTFDELDGVFKTEGIVKGLFIPSQQIINNIKNDVIITDDFLADPFKSTGDFPVTIKIIKYGDSHAGDYNCKYVTKIRQSLLRIHSEDIEVIRDILYPSPIPIPVPTSLQTPMPESLSDSRKVGMKTVNAMALFIKQLIAINYGDDVANSPRKHIDNPRGVIKNSFENKGLTPPSGNVVEKWLKNSDLD